ncbi:MAG: antitoxin [Fibrobacteraceae bacterium]|nr:antitoxin [Fibrobacteraceae bacterium]
MKKEYDFAKMQGRKNPYAKMLKKSVSLKLSSLTVEYFKKLSQTTGLPYTVLMDSYLSDCALKERKIEMSWK